MLLLGKIEKLQKLSKIEYHIYDRSITHSLQMKMSFDKIFDLIAGVYLNFYNMYLTQLAKMSFDKIFDLTAGLYFNFYNIMPVLSYLYRPL